MDNSHPLLRAACVLCFEMLVSKGKLMLVLHPQPLVHRGAWEACGEHGKERAHAMQSCSSDPHSCCVHIYGSQIHFYDRGIFLISFYLFNKVTGSMIRVQCLNHTSGTCLQQDLILGEPVTQNCALLNVPAAS